PAHRLGDPQLLAVVEFHRGIIHLLLRGRLSESLEHLETSARTWPGCVGVVMERNLTQISILLVLEKMGRLREMADRAAAQEREAADRGDLFGRINSAFSSLIPLLAADEVETARRRCREAIAFWPPGEFHVQHFMALR